MASIWSAGHPWKVESVTQSEMEDGSSSSRNSARSSRELASELFEEMGGVLEAPDEAGHLLASDSVQVVAHADVEDGLEAGRRWGRRRSPLCASELQ